MKADGKLVSLNYVMKTAEAASKQDDNVLLSFILDSAFSGRLPESLDRYLVRSSDQRGALLDLRELESHMRDFDEDCWEILFTFMLHLR